MTRLSNSEILKLKIDLAEPRLNVVSRALWDDPRLVDLFPEYLFRIFCSARAVVPLMRTALSCARARADDCPVAAQLVPYLEQHIEEELHHDEWLLEDMETLGVDRAEVLDRLPNPAVATLVGTLYYWVLHVHPVALLAYFAVVEGSPMSTGDLDRLTALGIPRSGLRTLYEHSELDIEHGEEVFHTLDELPLTNEHNALLGLAAVVIIDQLSDVIESLLEQPLDVASRTQGRARATVR